MGFLDKATEKLSKVTEQAKEKIDDVKDKRKGQSLLEDLGRVIYRQNTGRAADNDGAEISRIVGELQALEAAGVEIIAGDTPPPPPSSSAGPSGDFPSPS